MIAEVTRCTRPHWGRSSPLFWSRDVAPHYYAAVAVSPPGSATTPDPRLRAGLPPGAIVDWRSCFAPAPSPVAGIQWWASAYGDLVRPRSLARQSRHDARGWGVVLGSSRSSSVTSGAGWAPRHRSWDRVFARHWAGLGRGGRRRWLLRHGPVTLADPVARHRDGLRRPSTPSRTSRCSCSRRSCAFGARAGGVTGRRAPHDCRPAPSVAHGPPPRRVSLPCAAWQHAGAIAAATAGRPS